MDLKARLYLLLVADSVGVGSGKERRSHLDPHLTNHLQQRVLHMVGPEATR